MIASDFTAQLHSIIAVRSLLKHPFYQAWNAGTLPLDSLREYARQYYHFELAYPTFLSGVHHRCGHRQARQLLLENLWDEEHGPDNHVELWLRFCDALGLDRAAVQDGAPRQATQELVGAYQRLTTQALPAAGAGALYAFESQVPLVAEAKIRGLREHYGLQDPRAISFFTVHQTLDVQHSAAELQMVLELADTPEAQRQTLDAVDQAAQALWQFLDGVYA
jgi:pyrroloquinoline-quinone synthase